MEKYYLVEISNGDSKISGKAIYEYDNVNDAVATFHTKLGNAMKSDLFTDELVMVVDSNGVIYKIEKYIATPVEPTPVEPEVVEETTEVTEE